MIGLSLKENQILIDLTGLTNAKFNSALRVVKESRAKWNPEKKVWITKPPKYQEIKEKLEDIDVLDDEVKGEQIEKILEVPSTQYIEPIRRVPDYSLMNFSPVEGIHPNEKFQHIGISKGINRSCYAYYWGMGSGKSYIAAALIAHRLYKYEDCAKVVLITSNIGVINLYHEMFKFIKGLDESKVKIANKDYRNPFDDSSTDIIITSYNSFRLICDYYRKKLKITSKKPRKPFLPLKEWAKNKPLMLILDESHNVANITSQQGHLVLLHAPLFKYRYEFSGTPADKIEKEYSQFRVLDPALVWNLSYQSWIDKMAHIGTSFSKYAIRSWKWEEVEKQNQRFSKSYGNYYRTSELVSLPKYLEKRIYVNMSDEHRKIYENLVIEDLEEKLTTQEITNRFPYMMISVDNPFLLKKHWSRFKTSFNLMLKNFKESQLNKFEAIDAILEDHPGEKGILWAIHPDSINRMAKRYAKLNPIVITGEIQQEERFPLIEEFRKGDHKLLIANIQCLNTSVTITEASFQVYVERSFDFTSYDQSTARAYRLGQKENFHSYLLIYNRSLDVLLDKSLQNKGTLVEGLVSKDFLTQDQWKKIFNCSESDDIESFAK